MLYRAQVVLDLLQQGNVTTLEQPERSPDCNNTEHIWDELDRAITSLDNLRQNLGELCQALLDECPEIPVECLPCLVISMARNLAAIIAARGRNTRYWPGMHKTVQAGSIMQKLSLFDQIYHNYHPMTFRYTHAANFSNINKCHH